jgi:hypothetical protein
MTIGKVVDHLRVVKEGIQCLHKALLSSASALRCGYAIMKNISIINIAKQANESAQVSGIALAIPYTVIVRRQPYRASGYSLLSTSAKQQAPPTSANKRMKVNSMGSLLSVAIAT